MATIKRNSGMKRIIIILAFLVCGISSAQQYFFNGTVYVPKTTVQINAITTPANGRVEANSDTGSLWYFDGAIWKDTFVGVSSFADLEGDPYDNAMLSDALNSKANDSVVVKINPNSLVSPLTLAVSDSTTIASGIFTINDVVIDTTKRVSGGDQFVKGGALIGDVLNLNMNYGSPIQIPGFNSGSGSYLLLTGGTMSGNINMGGFNITNVTNISPESLTYSKSGWRKWLINNGPSLSFSSENSLGSDSYTNRFTFNLDGSASIPTDVLNKAYGDANYKTSVSGTSTTLQLNSAVGYYGNMTTPNSSTSYTIGSSPVLGGWAKIRINAATQPTITGATLVNGDDFETSTDMYMIVTYNGVIAEYYFKKIGL